MAALISVLVVVTPAILMIRVADRAQERQDEERRRRKAGG